MDESRNAEESKRDMPEDRKTTRQQAPKPHRRVGNTTPGAASGRSADLTGAAAREKLDNEVRWDPVEGVHYISTSSNTPASPLRDQLSALSGDEARDSESRRSARVGGQSNPLEVALTTVLDILERIGNAVTSGFWAFVDGARAHPIRVVAGIAFVVVIAASYGPAGEYYRAWRTQQDLAALQAVLDEDNQNLQSDIDRLQSQEGIEDEARDYGYVYPSEVDVTTVDGGTDAGGDSADDVDGESDDASDSSSTGDLGTAGNETPTPDLSQPVYIDILDIVFRYTSPVATD